jgi:hypothetical protein
MDEGACYQRQFASGSRIVVCVVRDERFVNCFGAIFLSDQIEDFGPAEIAVEFCGSIVGFRGVGSGAFELCDGFGVAAGQRKYFGEFVAYRAVVGSFQEKLFRGCFGVSVATSFDVGTKLSLWSNGLGRSLGQYGQCE